MTARVLGVLIFSSAVLGVGCGGDEVRPASWTYISPALIQPNCATSSCHSKGAAVAGLDLSTRTSGFKGLLKQKLPVAGMLMNKNVPRAIVLPGNPAESRLVNMLRANGADRMPPDRPLAEADIALIEEWILEGAKE